MRGAFHTRPSLPRYQATWDVSIVLKYLRRHSPADKLNLQDLTIKLATLCSLVTGQHCQTIQLMDLENLQITKSSAKFPITDLVKHSRPGMDQPLLILILPAYPVDRRLCVLKYLKQYILATKNLRSSSKLFISYLKPHREVSPSSISLWGKLSLKNAGIDTNCFAAHSTRAASTSAAKMQNVPLETIMRAAGWTSSSARNNTGNTGNRW